MRINKNLSLFIMQKKTNFLIINIIIIIFICSIVTYFILGKEIRDMKGVNKVYHKNKIMINAYYLENLVFPC